MRHNEWVAWKHTCRANLRVKRGEKRREKKNRITCVRLHLRYGWGRGAVCGGSEVRVHVHVLFIMYDELVMWARVECECECECEWMRGRDHRGEMNAAKQEMIELWWSVRRKQRKKDLTIVMVSFHSAFCGQHSTLLASPSSPRAMDRQEDSKICRAGTTEERREDIGSHGIERRSRERERKAHSWDEVIVSVWRSNIGWHCAGCRESTGGVTIGLSTRL